MFVYLHFCLFPDIDGDEVEDEELVSIEADDAVEGDVAVDAVGDLFIEFRDEDIFFLKYILLKKNFLFYFYFYFAFYLPSRFCVFVLLSYFCFLVF